MAIIGYILIIISLVTNGLFFVVEEKLFNLYHLEPIQVVGLEGLFGLLFYAITIPIITFVPCTFGLGACVFSDLSFPYIERPGQYFSEAFASPWLLVFCILGIFSIASFNIFGATVTKYINALARSLADVVRTIVIWMIGILVTVTAGAHSPNYNWELLNGGVIVIQLLGFIILVFGNLIYNRMVKIPFLTGPEPMPSKSEDDLEVSLQPKGSEDD